MNIDDMWLRQEEAWEASSTKEQAEYLSKTLDLPKTTKKLLVRHFKLAYREGWADQMLTMFKETTPDLAVRLQE